MSDGPRGRVTLAALPRGTAYAAVFTPTGRCVYRTLSTAEAKAMAARNPRLTWQVMAA